MTHTAVSIATIKARRAAYEARLAAESAAFQPSAVVDSVPVEILQILRPAGHSHGFLARARLIDSHAGLTTSDGRLMPADHRVWVNFADLDAMAHGHLGEIAAGWIVTLHKVEGMNDDAIEAQGFTL
jgi:non-ribosomal peptide synthetase component E (peptide arylation enzyme)